jgi:hypothetical protein
VAEWTSEEILNAWALEFAADRLAVVITLQSALSYAKSSKSAVVFTRLGPTLLFLMRVLCETYYYRTHEPGVPSIGTTRFRCLDSRCSVLILTPLRAYDRSTEV